jgi:hypothetical protein
MQTGRGPSGERSICSLQANTDFYHIAQHQPGRHPTIKEEATIVHHNSKANSYSGMRSRMCAKLLLEANAFHGLFKEVIRAKDRVPRLH